MSSLAMRAGVGWTAAVSVWACTTPAWQPEAPVVPGADWVLRNVPNAPLTVRMPAAVRERNQFGCYDNLDSEIIHGPGYQDFCISVVPPGQTVQSFEAITENTRVSNPCIDCMIYEEIATQQMRLGIFEATVQLALATGGIAHKERRPELLATFALDQSRVVVLRGEFGDANDAAVILGIAGTISAR